MGAKKKRIILEDGTEFVGTAFGADTQIKAELVFNTSMAGYQELFSDLSYTGQMVVMTYPLIGNYGICDDDYESAAPKMSALIVREYCDYPSNFRCTRTLGSVMEEYGIAGVAGIDTRKLARHIRDYGSCKACIVDEDRDYAEALEELRAWIPDTEFVKRVSTPEIYDFDERFCASEGETQSEPGSGTETGAVGEIPYGSEGIRIGTEGAVEAAPEIHAKKIVVIDCGVKLNILRQLAGCGCHVTVVPWNTPADKILAMCPDGVLVSNGPGNPEDVQPTIQTVKALIGKIPIFGICLGHQIVSLAYGAKTYKLKFGHRGGNHPVKNLKTDKVEITSQNHSYAVDSESLKNTGLTATHINILDNTVEGVECARDRVMSVQYHPEAAPGPRDGNYLFGEFFSMISGRR